MYDLAISWLDSLTIYWALPTLFYSDQILSISYRDGSPGQNYFIKIYYNLSPKQDVYCTPLQRVSLIEHGLKEMVKSNHYDETKAKLVRVLISWDDDNDKVESFANKKYRQSIKIVENFPQKKCLNFIIETINSNQRVILKLTGSENDFTEIFKIVTRGLEVFVIGNG